MRLHFELLSLIDWGFILYRAIRSTSFSARVAGFPGFPIEIQKETHARNRISFCFFVLFFVEIGFELSVFVHFTAISSIIDTCWLGSSDCPPDNGTL